MKRVIWLPLATAMCLLPVLRANAQTPSPQPTNGILVAVVDIPHVLDNYSSFQQQIEGIKGEITSFEAEVTGERQQLVAQGKRLQDLKPGTTDYKRLEEKLTRDGTDMQLKIQLKRKELMEAEAKALYEAYAEMLTHIQQIATQHNISLVLRYDSKQIDPADGSSVARGLQRTVVLQRNLDITSMVLEKLNGVAQKPGAPRR